MCVQCNQCNSCNPCNCSQSNNQDHTPVLLDCNTLVDTMTSLKERFERCQRLSADDMDLLIDVIYSIQNCPSVNTDPLNNIIIDFDLPAVTLESEIHSQINLLPQFDVDETQIAFFNVDVDGVPSKYVLRLGKGSYGNGGTTLLNAGDIYLVSREATSESKFKLIHFGSANSPFDGPVDMAIHINNLIDNATDYKTILDGEIPLFVGYVSQGRQRSTFNKYVIDGYSTGTYGQGGNITLVTNDVQLVETDAVGGLVFPPLGPNAVVNDLGEIGTDDFETWINGDAVGVTIGATGDQYIEFTNGGLRRLYRYDGPSGTFNSGNPTFDDANTFLIYLEENNPNTHEHEGYYEEGTRDAAVLPLKVRIGDHDSSNGGTYIEIDDDNGEINCTGDINVSLVNLNGSGNDGNLRNLGNTADRNYDFPDKSGRVVINESLTNSTSLTLGSTATGTGSVSGGLSTGSGPGTLAAPSASGIGAIAFGTGTEGNGNFSAAHGVDVDADSFCEVAFGYYPTTYVASSAVAGVATDRLFNLGNGVSPAARSDAFQVLKGGEVFAPSLTNPLIDAAAGTILVTKDWVNANAGGGALQPLDEGNGIGYRINAVSNIAFGNIGADAVDLSFATGFSDNKGATGQYSFAAGLNNIVSGFAAASVGYDNTASGEATFTSGTGNVASGDWSMSTGDSNTVSGISSGAIGSSNDVQGDSSVALGSGHQITDNNGFASGADGTVNGNAAAVFNNSNTAEGNNSAAFGESNTAQSLSEFVVGMNGTDYVPGSTSTHVATDRVLNVGNGVNTGARSDAFTVLKGGEVLAPSLDVAKIDAATDNVLVTKEWAQPKRIFNTLNFLIEQTLVDATSGTLVIGKTYLVDQTEPGDDFSNVGWVADGVEFVATGTTPTSWANGSYVVNITDSQPTVDVLENSFTGVNFTYEFSYTNGITVEADSGVFLINKTGIVTGNVGSANFVPRGGYRIDDDSIGINGVTDTYKMYLEIKVYN